MYKFKPGIKKDMERRWALPDRVFFGNGACHILAGVFLDNPPLPDFYAERVIPLDGLAGNHIYVTNGIISFDFHGYTARLNLLRHHTTGWSDRYADGWACSVARVDFDLLDTSELNGRRMLGPDQYVLGDPVSRARMFIGRIDHRSAAAKAARTVRQAVPAQAAKPTP